MTFPVRRAGRLMETDGRVTSWSVAEGRRGRRWRWVTGNGDQVDVTHTLETDPSGAFVRVESAGAWGLLTLHREADCSLHGHRVGPTGISHLAMRPPVPSSVLVGDGLVGIAALLGPIGRVAEAVDLEAVLVADDATVAEGRIRLRPVGRRSIEGLVGDRLQVVSVDPDGLPTGADGSLTWALELD